MKLSKKIQQQLLQYSEQQKPNEACGLLIQKGRSIQFLPCENTEVEPTKTFQISPDDFIKASEQGELLAVFHSHPDGEPFLSSADRFYQIQTQLTWVLAVSGSLKVFPCVPRLRGREFEYGVNDCAVLVRDAFTLSGIEIEDHPRTTMDADHTSDALRQHMLNVGFKVVDDNSQIQAGDVILTSIKGNAQHLALYLGNEQMLHHAYNTLSRREPFSEHWKFQLHSVMRHPLWQPEMIEAIQNDLEVTV